ncbi:uncharacterized protein [Salminus brasiliensis]|uniref:uncharacterized protein n=1 Tax=Salminus brasiliensis TaxID=930266 RepID=UPI003B8369C0
MSVRFFIPLLSLYLSFQKVRTDAELNLTTVLQYNLNKPDSVSVVCQYDWQEGWDMVVKLLDNSNTVCETSKVKRCKWSQKKNQTEFTLKNLTFAQKNLFYHCEVFRRSPLPIIKGKGVHFRLFPETHILPNTSWISVDPDNVCHPPESNSHTDTLIWVWALIGLMLLLCLYSLIITTLYIKLKIKRSEYINDTLTYVPMQVKPKKQVRRHDADKNAEYVDMRKVYPQGGPIRDMNYNSHQIPAGFTM